MRRIYLDYAATTPVDPRVLRAMEPYFGARGGKFGNPGSLHSFGQEAIAAVDRARESIAAAIGAEFREVIFTSSATEANNLALRGVLAKWHEAVDVPRIVVSAIEHESVLETVRELARDGRASREVEIVYLPVDRRGIIDLKALKASLNERTILVSIMYANNEIGTIQPIADIAKIIREFRQLRSIKSASESTAKHPQPYPLFHTDAVQAFQFLDCDIEKLGVDLMTLSSHKIYGPKGAAALFARASGNILKPLIFGGGQEFGLRSGTENAPAIVGFAKAVELAVAAREKESKRIAVLRDRLWHGIKKGFPKAEWNGAGKDAGRGVVGAAVQSLPNILNVYFPGHAAQDILTRLDLAGVAVSSGSACRSRALESSYVIEALGGVAKSSIRFSLGRLTTAKEIDGALKVLKSFRII